jgi:N-acetylglutamate synthase-like GNAT family acetyltransferase
MIEICKAEIENAEFLTELSALSETHWGHDKTFIERFKNIYQVSEDFIRMNPTFMLQENHKILGFYGLKLNSNCASLEYLFIEPNSIGKGYGRELWNHICKICKSLGVKELEIVSSPKAKDFYTRMGANYSGEVDSPVVFGGKLPRLVFTID